MTTLLTAAQILDAEDLPVQDVAVPEWGGTVRVRSLTGTERDKLEASMIDNKGQTSAAKLASFRARLAALSMVDADGQRLFGDAEVAKLGAKSAAALARVSEAAMKLSGLSKEDVQELAGE